MWDDDSNDDETPGVNNIRGENIPITSITTLSDPNQTDPNQIRIVLDGAYRNKLYANDGFYIGKTFLTNVELSPIFLRDENLDAQNVSLNLRLGMFRFRNSGDFEVSVQRKQREPKIVSHVIDMVDDAGNPLTYKPYNEFGVFKLPILGYSQDLKININSTSVHPLAITDIEFTGKAKFKITSLGAL